MHVGARRVAHARAASHHNHDRAKRLLVPNHHAAVHVRDDGGRVEHARGPLRENPARHHPRPLGHRVVHQSLDLLGQARQTHRAGIHRPASQRRALPHAAGHLPCVRQPPLRQGLRVLRSRDGSTTWLRDQVEISRLVRVHMSKRPTVWHRVPTLPHAGPAGPTKPSASQHVAAALAS